MTDSFTGQELRSTVTEGKLALSLEPVTLDAPGPGEVIVRIEAAPLNPSDLGLLLGPADLASLRRDGDATVADIPEQRMAAMTARVGQSMTVGNEGAGTVVAAGDGGEALVGKTVAAIGGGMYAQFRKLKPGEYFVLPDGVSARDGASAFVNPLTALAMVETMQAEGHSALVHTAAASNLGQMLNRICLADGVPLVNIVRSAEQERILRDIGATHVVDSSREGFRDDLVAALAETKATIAFDAIGGGKLAGQILAAMEAAASRGAAYSRYGSNTHKQVYIYGALDLGPTLIGRDVGFAWGVGGFLLTPFLMKTDPAITARMRARVANEITTTFASHYTGELSLAEAIDPANIARYQAKRTGEKYLIVPQR